MQRYEDSDQGTGYDPDNMFRVSTSLLRQIQALAKDDMCDTRCTIPDYRWQPVSCSTIDCLSGHARFGTIPDSRRLQRRYDGMEVNSTSDRHARISWSRIPENFLKMDMKIALYEEEMNQIPLERYDLDGHPYGSTDTRQILNPGLHLQLKKTEGTAELELIFRYSLSVQDLAL